MTSQCSTISCFLSSCCQKPEFQNTCPNKFETYRKGHTLYKESKDNVYIILSGVGLVSMHLGADEEELQLCLLGKGQVFGAFTPFSRDKDEKSKWPVYLRAITDMEVCKISSRWLRQYTEQHPALLYEFISAGKALTRAAMRQAWIKSPRKIYDRVLRALVVLNEMCGKNLTISHDDMALIVCADRPSVTLALDKLRDEGFVSLEYRKISLNATLTSYELEFALKPDCDRLSMLPPFEDI